MYSPRFRAYSPYFLIGNSVPDIEVGISSTMFLMTNYTTSWRESLDNVLLILRTWRPPMGTSCFCCIIYRVARRAGENQSRVDTNNILLGRLYNRFEPPPAINSDPLVATGVLNSGGFRQNPRLIDYDASTLPPTFDANGHLVLYASMSG